MGYATGKLWGVYAPLYGYLTRDKEERTALWSENHIDIWRIWLYKIGVYAGSRTVRTGKEYEGFARTCCGNDMDIWRI